MAFLVIVGTGISIGQLSIEALGHIESSDRVVALVADSITLAWLKKRNASTESLNRFYAEHKNRADTYSDIVNHVLSLMRRDQRVCLVLYGHPGVFAFPAHELMRQAKKKNIPAIMLPGISAEDCLFADLGLDTGTSGCQSFEATDFLVHERQFDPRSALILWQISVIGEAASPTSPNLKNLHILAETLAKTYSKSHEVVLYEASVYPHCDPKKQRVRIDRLASASVSAVSTLFVPPLLTKSKNAAILRRLGAKPADRR